jgi:hypothetical protein
MVIAPHPHDPFLAFDVYSPSVRRGRAALPAAGMSVSKPQSRGDPRSALEVVHPGVTHAITLLWGHGEMNDYFERLWIADEHSGPIDPEAMSDLMLLAQVHQWIVPKRVPAHQMGTMYSLAAANAGPPHRATRRRHAW